MKGLWHVKTRGVDPGGIVVWYGITTFVTLASLASLLHAVIKYRQHSKIATLSLVGLGFLAAWLFCHWIDLMNLVGGMCAMSCLVLRSFVELVILSVLCGHPKNLSALYIGRDVMYGLFSAAFSIGYVFSAPAKNFAADNKAAYHEAVEDVRGQFKARLDVVTNEGRLTAPELTEILQDIQPGEGSQRPTANITQWDEIKRLKRVYGAWRPIPKSQ
ncbi:hypothetical protein FKW77_007214 [Venturia effusa]|uniref:Uncharacterized protein n=1 Tax=Venturia effusa TaxID=50376 RepID=A0A517LJ43_9PEZI|nr:hypothetical protein FKW77_007214 [Venturia effusa]